MPILTHMQKDAIDFEIHLIHKTLFWDCNLELHPLKVKSSFKSMVASKPSLSSFDERKEKINKNVNVFFNTDMR